MVILLYTVGAGAVGHRVSEHGDLTKEEMVEINTEGW